MRFDWYRNYRPWMTLNGRYAKMRLLKQTTKIWMNYEDRPITSPGKKVGQQLLDFRNIRYMQIFARVPRGGASNAVELSTTAIFGDFNGYFSGNFRVKVSIILFFLLVRERSALADPYCQSAWNSACGFVCPQLWGQISRKPKELGGKLLWGAYRNVVGGFRLVTSPMTSRDPMTS